jgi:hypothetical protein
MQGPCANSGKHSFIMHFFFALFFGRVGPTDCGAAPSCWLGRLVPWDFNDRDMYLSYESSAARWKKGEREGPGRKGGRYEVKSARVRSFPLSGPFRPRSYAVWCVDVHWKEASRVRLAT